MGKKHSYAMIEDIRTFAAVCLGPGTLYGAITRLEERGWIRAVDVNAGGTYRLRPRGRRQLQENLRPRRSFELDRRRLNT